MASVANDPGGRRRILFVDGSGQRKTIRLGKLSQRDAEGVCRHVETLLSCRIAGQPVPRDTAAWLVQVGDTLRDKLAKAELIAPREQQPALKLGTFLDAHLAKRTDIKPASLLVQQQVVRNLKEHFGADCDPRTITPGNADDFKRWLVTEGLASTTVHKRLQHVRAYFRAMVRHKLIVENPFSEVRSPAIGISARQRFVTQEETTRVLECCPNHHWRTIIALSRYGGLRCPSEVLSLRWQDVDWAARRITVQSPKGKCHGKGTRVIPLFPELRPILEQAWELAPEGTTYVVDERMRKAAMKCKGDRDDGNAIWANANLRTTFEKIVRRAGLTAWPRMFHNLRASRETELAKDFEIQVVTSWLGNTPAVAMRHYLMTTDAHFAAALGEGEPAKVNSHTAAQNAAQHVQESECISSQVADAAHEKTPEFPGFASACTSVLELPVAEQGFEP